MGNETAPQYKPKLVSVSLLDPHPLNPRDDFGDVAGLAASIAADGLLEPVVIQRRPDAEGRYWILGGHRRVEAARSAGERLVPATERPDRGPGAAVVTMLVENGHREPLNPMAKARAFGYLRDEEGLTLAEIARKTGFGPSVISESLALLELTPDTQEAVRTGQLSAGKARAAVRKVHKQTGRNGRTPVTWEPDHFTARHPLAQAARARCRQAGHTCRHKVGKVACGQCWEDVIRDDAVRQATAGAPAPAVTTGAAA